MATVDRASVPSTSSLQLQQNIPFRSRSPSSPIVLSKPTTSRRKSTSPPKQQFIRGSVEKQQYSATTNPRPIHSMYSASQPHLNTDNFDVQYRLRSRTTSTFDRKNRWSTTGIKEENNFNTYDPRLTKRSVEDLRLLPIPVAAPKVPPRRGSRLTTVPNERYRENAKVEVQNHCETRSCEDLLESVSTAESKAYKDGGLKSNGHFNQRQQGDDAGTIMIQDPKQYQIPYPTVYHENLTQPQPSFRFGSATGHLREPEVQQGQISSQEIKPGSHYLEGVDYSRKNHVTAIPAENHSNGVSCPNETENIQVVNNKSKESCISSSQWKVQRHSQLAGEQVANGDECCTSEQSQHFHMNREDTGGVSKVRVSVSDTEEGYQRNVPVVAPCSSLSKEHTYSSHHYGSVPYGTYNGSDPCVSSTVTQQSSPPPKFDMVSDANLRMTPHTSCTSPPPTPQAHRDNKEVATMNIPQSYNHNKDNKITTTHIPHYAISTEFSDRSRHTQEQTLPTNTPTSTDLVQRLTVVQGGLHSYRPEPDQPSHTSSNSEFHQHQHQTAHRTAAAMDCQSVSVHTHPVEAHLSEMRKCEGSGVDAESQSSRASQKTQALAQALSLWQYQDTGKQKQVSSKQNVQSQSKPPIKPKPARLMKGGSASLKRDKKKSQHSDEGRTEKSGQKYIFKQSQSRSLLERGRTPSQVDPLTDVGMDIQYGSYTPHKYHQSSSGSSSDSTLRGELTFTENKKDFAGSGPSPNSYDYGSQMTLTGDATLTPYSPSNGYHSSSTVYYDPHVANPTVPRTTETNTKQNYTFSTNTATHAKTSTPHSTNDSHPHLPMSVSSQNRSLSTSSSDLNPKSTLAPIAEVNIESEQSNTNLLNTTDASHDTKLEDKNVTKSSSFDNASIFPVSNNSSSQISDTQESEDKPSPTVQRSSTLPSAYKRPKPYRFNTTKYVSTDIQGQDSDQATAFTSSSMKLSDFTALNASAFPKHVKISNHLTCETGDMKLSQGDILDLHFVRQMKAVVLISANGDEYIVPLNSAIKFSLTYDPLNTGQLMHQGYHFKSVGELIATRQLPPVVMATESYIDSTPQSSVEAGEVLIICGVAKQAHRTLLKVNSISQGKKLLEQRCTVNFSTRSEDTKLSLHDMFKASMQLPLQALIFPPSGLQLPECLVDAPVTLKLFCVLKSVIATPSVQSTSAIPQVVYDINLNLDIEVQEGSEITDKQLNEMHIKTQHLYNSFELTKIVPFHSSKLKCREQLSTQTALLTNFDYKSKFHGMQLELPEWLGQIRLSKAKQTAVQLQRQSLSQPLLNHDGAEIGLSPIFKGGAALFQSANGTSYSTEQRMTDLEKKCKKMDTKLNTLVRSFTEVVKQLSLMKMQKQQQTGTEINQEHNQYVDMVQDSHVPNHESMDSHALSSSDNQCHMESKTQQTEEPSFGTSKVFDEVKEWQKKQEKHLRWQQEQVQQWQIECEKQMQEMQEKLLRLEDRQMKFFLDTQQKLKQWKAEQETVKTACHKQPELVGNGNQNEIHENKKLPPKPTTDSEDLVANASATPSKGKQDSTGENDTNSEVVDSSLDTIADNIASWCSQMELELNELYSNSVK